MPLENRNRQRYSIGTGVSRELVTKCEAMYSTAHWTAHFFYFLHLPFQEDGDRRRADTVPTVPTVQDSTLVNHDAPFSSRYCRKHCTISRESTNHLLSYSYFPALPHIIPLLSDKPCSSKTPQLPQYITRSIKPMMATTLVIPKRIRQKQKNASPVLQYYNRIESSSLRVAFGYSPVGTVQYQSSISPPETSCRIVSITMSFAFL